MRDFLHDSRHPKPYLVTSELAFLESILDEISRELVLRGLINPMDPGYADVRLRLAAVILCHAADGESDPVKLKRSALDSLEPCSQVAPRSLGDCRPWPRGGTRRIA